MDEWLRALFSATRWAKNSDSPNSAQCSWNCSSVAPAAIHSRRALYGHRKLFLPAEYPLLEDGELLALLVGEVLLPHRLQLEASIGVLLKVLPVLGGEPRAQVADSPLPALGLLLCGPEGLGHPDLLSRLQLLWFDHALMLLSLVCAPYHEGSSHPWGYHSWGNRSLKG
jgi:hypothetical protein